MAGHVPVMVAEAMHWLEPARGGFFVDCTVGLGGHARALLEGGATQVLGLDRDDAALAHAREALGAFGARVELVHADYRDLGAVLDARGRATVDGAIADLGVSSLQLDAPERGFSFRATARSTCAWTAAGGPRPPTCSATCRKRSWPT